ncbi:MAG: hypothetical protein R3321_13785 [Nitrososphaeraceae archaeon]|nr:hypothetical protein [Nitrososphaeraceae archaeon]
MSQITYYFGGYGNLSNMYYAVISEKMNVIWIVVQSFDTDG